VPGRLKGSRSRRPSNLLESGKVLSKSRLKRQGLVRSERRSLKRKPTSRRVSKPAKTLKSRRVSCQNFDVVKIWKETIWLFEKLIQVALLGALILTAYQVKNWALESPLFSLKQVAVELSKSDGKITEEEVIKRVSLPSGLNIWKVNSEEISKKIKENQWVKEVVVSKRFPNRVVIRVEAYEARWLYNQKGALYFVDPNGVIFKPALSEEGMDYPILSHFDPEEAPQVVEAFKEISSELQTSIGIHEAHISEFIWSRFGHHRLVIQNYPHSFELKLGLEELKEKGELLKVLLARLEESHLSPRVIDLLSGKKGVVKIYSGS